MLRPGVVIASRYRLLRCLGEGGMGEVWSAVLPHGRLVALKFLKLNAGRKAEILARFEREACIGRALKHPNVACAEGFLPSSEGGPVLVMELLRGETLETRLACEGRLSVDAASRIGAQIAAGLEAAHAAGIVHRDLKPSNVFLTRDGGVRVLDFGIARAAFATPLTSEGHIIGTPAYLAPEQMRGASVDGRADVWAFGVVLFQMLGGRLPWINSASVTELFSAMLNVDPPRLDEVAPVPSALADVVHAMLRRDAAQRFADLSEVRSLLRAYSAPAAPPPLAPSHAHACKVALMATALAAGGGPFADAFDCTLEMTTLVRAM